MTKKIVVLALIALLCSCSSKSSKDANLKPADLVKFKATADVKRNWSVDVGAGHGKRYTRFVPAIDGARVYAADAEGNVSAYKLDSGKKIWRVDTGLQIGGAINAVDGQLYLGTYDGYVVALSEEDGHLLWKSEVSSEVISPPASDGTYVVADTLDGRAYGFKAKTGEQLWRYDHPMPILTLRGLSTPVISREQVLVGFDNGQLLSLGLEDGSVQWSIRLSQPSGRTDLEKMVDVDSKPVIDGGLVYDANYHGSVVALSRAQGKAIWKQEVSTQYNIAVGQGLVIVTDEDSHIYAYDANSGAITWKNTSLHRRNAGAPAIIGNYVAVIDEDNYLHLLSIYDGSFAYRFKPKGKRFHSQIVSYDKGFLTFSGSSELSSYRIVDKKK